MTRVIKHAFAMAIMSGLILGLTGCPFMPKPPFSAAGQYDGTWTDSNTGISCDFSMSLTHLPNTPYPVNFLVGGLVSFDYECALAGEVDEGQEVMDAILDAITDVLGEQELPELTIPVVGEMNEDGSGGIELGVDTEMLELPWTVSVQFTGTGDDNDADGQMDTYAGTYTMTITINLDTTQYEDVPEEYQQIIIEFEGDFEVAEPIE